MSAVLGGIGWEDGPQEPNRSSTDARIAYIDQYTAQPIAGYGFGQYGWAGKATSFGIALHEGREWGLINQVLVTIATVAILLSVASSMVMCRRRARNLAQGLATVKRRTCNARAATCGASPRPGSRGAQPFELLSEPPGES